VWRHNRIAASCAAGCSDLYSTRSPGPIFVPPSAVAFQEDGMAFVDLGEREVMARFQAAGQMSFIPGIWDPVWSSGQVRVTESVNY